MKGDSSDIGISIHKTQEGEKIIEEEKIEIPQNLNIKMDSSDFLLDKSSIKGANIILQDNELAVVKTMTGHCAITTKKSFYSGKHIFNITFNKRESWCGEFWIMIGVHADPPKGQAHPTGDPGAYGVSLHQNSNGWVTKAGNTTYSSSSNRKIKENDVVQICLDCDNWKMIYIHKEWKAVLSGLPTTKLFIFLDPYDLSFNIDATPNADFKYLETLIKDQSLYV